MNKTQKEKGIETREKILQAIISYIGEHQYPPSVRELCHITGIRSTATVNGHINKMLKTGQLETDSGIGTPRALRVPGYKIVKE